MGRHDIPTHTHELPAPIELHFGRKEKDGAERLALVAYDRGDPERNVDGTLKCPCIWFDGKGRVHNSYINFNTQRSHGFIGKIHMPAGKAIDMIYPQAAIWSVYSIIAFQLGKVDMVEDKPSILVSSPDHSFILLTNHLLSTFLFTLPRGFFTYHPDPAAHAKLHSLGGGDVAAENFTKGVYLKFHKVVDEKPGDLFSVRDPEVIGRAAWDGLGAEKEEQRKEKEREESMMREIKDLKRLIRGFY
ncbi:hypothetical protein ACMFMG_003869 [Clarireedia jacksonii]